MRIESLVFAPALAILLLVTPAVALGQNPCAGPGVGDSEQRLAQEESGLSGTGLSGDEESGVGGTGLSQIAQTGDESGIGGTGYGGDDESGIGGTGIFGTITSFGSICVNGLRIHYDDTTPVAVDGNVSSSRALAVGQVVAVHASVHASGQGSVFEATSVAIHSALTGPITSLDYEENRLSVMGQTVIAPDDFSREGYGFALGSRVSVSGLRRSDGSVVATRIVPARTDGPDGVWGIAETSADGNLKVGGIRLLRSDVDAIALDDDATRSGQFIRITGSWNRETSSLEASAVSSAPLFRVGVERVSIEGYIAGDRVMRLLGFELDRPSLDRALDQAHRDRRLRVTGRRDAAGLLRVERLQIVDRPELDPMPRPQIERPEPTTLNKRPDQVVPAPPKPPVRPPKIERPDIDRPPRIDRVIKRIDAIKIDHVQDFKKE